MIIILNAIYVTSVRYQVALTATNGIYNEEKLIYLFIFKHLDGEWCELNASVSKRGKKSGENIEHWRTIFIHP